MVICLEQGADLHIAQLMPLYLALVKSILVLPFWYRLTWVVPGKEPLNVCVCVCVCVYYLQVHATSMQLACRPSHPADQLLLCRPRNHAHQDIP